MSSTPVVGLGLLLALLGSAGLCAAASVKLSNIALPLDQNVRARS